MSDTAKFLIPLFKPIWNNCGLPVPMHKMYIGEYYNRFQWQLNCSDKITLLGNNTGNCFFIESVVKQLGLENCAFFADLRDNSKEFVQEHFQAIVVPSSNFIAAQESGGLNYFTSLMEKYDLPLLIIGIGSQLSSGEKPCSTTIKNLHKISERCTSIGVRGELTAEILVKNGIKNVEVIGCPTVFSSLNPEFKVKKEEPDWSKPIAFNTELRDAGIDFLLKMSRISPTRFYMQNEMNFWFEKSRPHPYACKVLSWTAMQQHNSKLTLPQFREIRSFIEQNALLFFNTLDWRTSLRECVMSLGMRFHGNMMALQAGIPAVWLVHDNRTRELLNLLQLPTFKFSEDLDLQQIYAEADYSEFNKRYPTLYSNYREFLLKNGIISNKLG